MTTFSIVMTEEHDVQLRGALFATEGVEGAAYILFREAKIDSDPWDRVSHTKLLMREVNPIEPLSADSTHVTWDTRSFIAMLQRAANENLVLAIAHSHPHGPGDFSEQDNENEAELLRTTCIRNGKDAKLVSVLVTGDGNTRARVWQYPKHATTARSVVMIGERFRFHKPVLQAVNAAIFDRQILAFGPTLIQQLKGLRVAVIGAGGTGSATAPLLVRAGVGQLLIIDDDIVEYTNLNRLHGASQADADAMRPKAIVVAADLARLGLGARIIPMQGWVSDRRVRDALKSCDVIFCCTDDHAGRVFLNRLAYFYLIPVIDMGLAMAVAEPPRTGMADIAGRVTTIMPPETCLLCRGAIDPETARAEDLRRQNPTEYERRKREAYVRGEGNPNPAVVTFTTEVACMAVNELINRIVGYRRKNLGSEIRRRFLYGEDRMTTASPRPTCSVCHSQEYWGMGDVDPFLDIVG